MQLLLNHNRFQKDERPTSVSEHDESVSCEDEDDQRGHK